MRIFAEVEEIAQSILAGVRIEKLPIIPGFSPRMQLHRAAIALPQNGHLFTNTTHSL
jgi:hypothetical protein